MAAGGWAEGPGRGRGAMGPRAPGVVKGGSAAPRGAVARRLLEFTSLRPGQRVPGVKGEVAAGGAETREVRLGEGVGQVLDGDLVADEMPPMPQREASPATRRP